MKKEDKTICKCGKKKKRHEVDQGGGRIKVFWECWPCYYEMIGRTGWVKKKKRVRHPEK